MVALPAECARVSPAERLRLMHLAMTTAGKPIDTTTACHHHSYRCHQMPLPPPPPPPPLQHPSLLQMSTHTYQEA